MKAGVDSRQLKRPGFVRTKVQPVVSVCLLVVADQALPLVLQLLGELSIDELRGLTAEIAGNHQRLSLIIATLVNEDMGILFVKYLVATVHDHWHRSTQLDQLLIVVEDRLRIVQGFFDVDVGIVRIDVDPWRRLEHAIGEAAVL